MVRRADELSIGVALCNGFGVAVFDTIRFFLNRFQVEKSRSNSTYSAHLHRSGMNRTVPH